MKIEDEHGVTWVVEAGDPARTAVLALGRRGFRWVVLPRALLRGSLKVDGSGVNSKALPPGSSGAMPEMPLTRRCRLTDCLLALGGS